MDQAVNHQWIVEYNDQQTHRWNTAAGESSGTVPGDPKSRHFWLVNNGPTDDFP